jgi:CheY-like chemotaxis protein
MERWRLLLVDDHALFREGLAGLFAYQDDFLVVGEAGDAASAVRKTAEVHPDLVLMDIDMPGEDGVATTRRIKLDFPDVTVVMLTVHDATDKLLEAIKAGTGLPGQEHPQRRTPRAIARTEARRGGDHAPYGSPHPRRVPARPNRRVRKRRINRRAHGA